MKRKALVVIISALLIGCLSIPVFAADPAPKSKVKPTYHSILKYEDLLVNLQSNEWVITFKIFTKDKNGKKLAENSGLRYDTIHKYTYKTAKNSKAKYGYYGYNVQVVGTSHSVYFDKNY